MAAMLARVRYLAIVAVVGVLVQAVVTYGWAAYQTFDFCRDLFVDGAAEDDRTVVELLQVLDLYLIGTVLMITSIGLYELFVGPVELPSWLVITTLSDLKTKLVEVIVLVLGLKFVEKAVTATDAQDVFWYGLGTASVAAVLIAWNAVKVPSKEKA
jgi:uncharacterized membrane protein YqhA